MAFVGGLFVRWADGIGFGIGHSMVTMMFESSLQAVNPKLSLPYWDFTIESYLIDTVYDGDYTKLREATDLWSPQWFGGVDPADFQVKETFDKSWRISPTGLLFATPPPPAPN